MGRRPRTQNRCVARRPETALTSPCHLGRLYPRRAKGSYATRGSHNLAHCPDAAGHGPRRFVGIRPVPNRGLSPGPLWMDIRDCPPLLPDLFAELACAQKGCPMTSRALVLGILLGVAIVVGIAVGLLFLHIQMERHRVERRLVHLLCETDHEWLLEACRNVSKRTAAGEYEAGRAYAIRRYPGRYRLPQAILDVDPLFVKIDGEGLVWVELFWAPSQGVVAYPEGYEFRTDHRAGDRELVPGLWFYDEHYSPKYPKYMEYIDGLISARAQAEGHRFR